MNILIFGGKKQMIKLENIEVFGWEAAIRGMRNPLNSWVKSDSDFKRLKLGSNDYKLMKQLCKAGKDHRKYMRMINIYIDITAPLYWWKEFDTYKVGTVANSCSTMHKIHAKGFTLEDFSHEHLLPFAEQDLKIIINSLNKYRDKYLETKDKQYWWQMIQLLPSSYNQKRTVQLNYEVLNHMYHSRKSHKLDEWKNFCKLLKNMPYSELITGEFDE